MSQNSVMYWWPRFIHADTGSVAVVSFASRFVDMVMHHAPDPRVMFSNKLGYLCHWNLFAECSPLGMKPAGLWLGGGLHAERNLNVASSWWRYHRHWRVNHKLGRGKHRQPQTRCRYPAFSCLLKNPAYDTYQGLCKPSADANSSASISTFSCAIG